MDPETDPYTELERLDGHESEYFSLRHAITILQIILRNFYLKKYIILLNAYFLN